MEINIQQRLKHIRLKNQFTQKQIANGIEVKEKAYQAYEEGRSIPSIFTLLKLADFYGYTSLDVMLGVKDGESKFSEFTKAYYAAPADKRRIVDFVLNLNC